MKTQKYKVVTLTRGYNFNIKCIFISHHIKQYYFSNVTNANKRLLYC
jgi:hypothetical protein